MERRDQLIRNYVAQKRRNAPQRPKAKGVRAKRKPIAEDDPRWRQMPGHGQGQEHKVGANITLPRARPPQAASKRKPYTDRAWS
jgi:hypothetical protein